MIAKFNIGDRVSTIPTGQVSCGHKKLGIFSTNGYARINEVIISSIFNEDEKEYWYQFVHDGNWYNESGLIRVYEEVKNYEIY